MNPNTFNDVDGRYIGFDGDVHTLAAGHTQYTNFSDWDTYRGLASLHGLLFPEQASDMAQSLVNDAEQSGSFPRWALANTATAEMTGDSVVPLMVNFYAFGAKDFDVHTALRYMVKAATEGGAGLNGYVERPEIATYLQRGYLPLNADSCSGWRDPRCLDHVGVVGRRLHHLPIRRRAGRFRDRHRIPEPGPVLAEPVQSHHPLHLAA